MPNLIEELSPNYCNEMLNGAMFLHDGDPHVFSNCDSTEVHASRYAGSAEKVNAKPVSIPASAFSGWSAFEFPILGYRMAAEGQILGYVTRVNSTRRGLNQMDCRINLHDVSMDCERVLGVNTQHFTHLQGKIPLIMKPKYMSYAEGITRILKGEIPSFALSADFAVAPHADVEFLEVLYRQRRIGTIDAGGNASITAAGIKGSWSSVSKEI